MKDLFKIIFTVIFALEVSNALNAKENDGTDPETTTIGIKTKFPFVDRSKMVNRGHIEYTVPEKRDDGIEVDNAKKNIVILQI